MVEHNYLVNTNAQSSGVRKVHKEGCDTLPDPDHRLLLGAFRFSNEAVKNARRHYERSEACSNCC